VIRSKGRTTIVDVANLAEVSTKTVSRVLNGERHVSEDVRSRVLAAARQLNYHPNVLAQALVRRRSHLIGLVYENPSPSYVVELQKGVSGELHGGRYRMVVLPTGPLQGNAGEVIGLLRSAALDGVVLAPPVSDDPTILAELEEAGIRFARIAPTRLLDVAPATLIDDVAAAREIAEYVIGLGHREIGIIRGDPTHASTEERMTGYGQAFRKAGLTMRLNRIEQGCYTFDSGADAARRLLAQSDRPTAILAHNDDMAVGAIMVAHQLGLSLPGDLSVVGFDDSAIANATWPRLTTVRQPVMELAATAAAMVVAMLEGEQPERRVRHSHELVIRESAVAPSQKT
jgi:LacI family transcriptional regulator